MNDIAIWTEKLVKVYSQVRAVDELSLNVPRGGIYGFLGRNGAGKTSTIKILLGLTRPTAGEARVLGFHVGREQVAILERTAYVSENKSLYGNLTARELVRFTRGFYPNWSDEAATKYARSFEIPMDPPFSKLSQGNRTRVFLLLALAQGADLLVFDEPATGLDPVGVDEFLRILAQDVVSEGRTVLISSHQLSDVEQVADHVGLIDHGRLLLEARLDDIKSQFRFDHRRRQCPAPIQVQGGRVRDSRRGLLQIPRQTKRRRLCRRTPPPGGNRHGCFSPRFAGNLSRTGPKGGGMYFWKCWRDSRSRFIFFLIVVPVTCVLFTIILATHGAFPDFKRGGPVSGVAQLWSQIATLMLGGVVSLIILLAALTLAVASIGEEYKEKTLDFLLTRPRRRRYWVWTCWSVGAGEILGLVVAGVVGTFGALSYESGYVYSWRLLATTLPLFVGAVAVYSLTYFLTVLARKGEQGISYGLGILLIDLFLPLAGRYWHVHLPSVLSFTFAGCEWATSSTVAFPLGKLIIYAVVALAFPLAAQLVLERAEV